MKAHHQRFHYQLPPLSIPFIRTAAVHLTIIYDYRALNTAFMVVVSSIIVCGEGGWLMVDGILG